MERIKYTSEVERAAILTAKEAEGMVLAEDQRKHNRNKNTSTDYLLFRTSEEALEHAKQEARQLLRGNASDVLDQLLDILFAKGTLSLDDFDPRITSLIQRRKDARLTLSS